MAQTFTYPNLLSGTRTGKGWTRVGSTGSFVDGHIEVVNSRTSEGFLFSPYAELRHGPVYQISAFTANTSNCKGSQVYVLYEDDRADGYIAKGFYDVMRGPGGGWFHGSFSIPESSPEGRYRIRFDNDGTSDGQPSYPSYLWFRDIMLCEAAEPHAWAPAEGEVWP